MKWGGCGEGGASVDMGGGDMLDVIGIKSLGHVPLHDTLNSVMIRVCLLIRLVNCITLPCQGFVTRIC